MRLVLPALIGILLFILWWTNPEEEQFSAFLTEQVTEIAGNAGADAGRQAGGAVGFLTDRLGRAAGEMAGAAIAGVAVSEFERSNYGVASSYTLDLNGRASGGTWTFLGIAGQFVPTEEPENVETLVRDMISRR